MGVMSSEILMAGCGAPKPHPPSDLAYWIDWVSGATMDANPKIVPGSGSAPDEIFLAACFNGPTTTLSSAASSGDTSIQVVNGEAFNTGRKKLIFIDGLENAIIQGMSGDTLTIDTDPARTGNQGLINDYEGGDGVYLVKVVSYSIVDNTLKRNENTGGGRQPLAENVVDLQFSQSGETIEISSLKAQTAKPDPNYSKNGGYRTCELRSFVTPPNLLLD